MQAAEDLTRPAQLSFICLHHITALERHPAPAMDDEDAKILDPK